MWQVNFENKLPKFNNPLFIEGLPGIGNVGKIVVDFLVDEFKAKKLCSFFSYKFPNSVFINEKNLVEMPKLEIYYKKFASKGKKRDLLLLTGDIQPIDEESSYMFCEEILNLLKRVNCKEMLTTGGIGLQDLPEKSKVYCTSNNEKLYNQYVKRGSGIEKEIFGVVGPIIGVSGILLGLGKMRNVKGVALLAETFGHPLHVGINGANEIMKVVEKKFKFGLNMKKISKQIIEMAEAEKELAKKTQEVMSEVMQAGAKLKKKEATYIG